MSFELIERVWDPDTQENADWFGVTSNTVVLLDGAAPRSTARVSSFANDTVWFVRRFTELFSTREAACDASTTLSRVEACRAQLADEYAVLCQRAGVAPSETPFSCLAIAHELGGFIELINIGDLTTLVRAKDGSVRRFGTSAVRHLDQEAIASLHVEITRGVKPHAARIGNVWRHLEENRARRNLLPGYDVLDVNVCCYGHAERLMCERDAITACIIMSDGFYRLVDTFRRHTDASLFRAAEESGLQGLLDDLRSIEGSDPDCVEYPRFKASDDATALWFEW